MTGTLTGGQSLHLNLAGTATDDKGVSAVNLTLYDDDTSKYLQPNGTLGTASPPARPRWPPRARRRRR